MKIYLIPFFYFLFIGSIVAQNNQTYTLDQLIPEEQTTSNIIVKQDKALESFLIAERDYFSSHKSLQGWRIQIFFSTGRGAKEGAELTRNKFMTDYPGTKAYVTYFPPYFKVYVGNYRTKREAANFRIQLLQEYPEAWLVKDKIEWPEL